MGFIVFLLLPALVSASITINIRAASTNNQSSATYFGEDFSVITDQELAAFNITDSFLKEAVGLYSGIIPLDVFVKDPSAWRDLYKTNHWSEVQRETKVINTKILSFHTKEVTLSHENFTNSWDSSFFSFVRSTSDYDAKFNIAKTFTGAKMAVDVKYNVDLIVEKHPAVHIEFESSFGNDTMVIAPQILEATGPRVLFQPNQSAEIILNANIASLGVVVNYETSLTGHVAVPNLRHKGNLFWAYDVKEVLKAGGLPVVKYGADMITVLFYSDLNVVVIDSQSGNAAVSEESQYTDYEAD